MRRLLTALAVLALGTPAMADEIDVDWYGFTQLDVYYDTNNSVAPGGFIQSVGAESDDGHFGVTANKTRFGAKITGLGEGDIKGSARLEMDFWDNNGSAKTYGNAGNQPNPRMRLAYGTLELTKAAVKIHAGQMWELVSPLNPSMLEHSPLFRNGNQGFRKPMLVVEKGIKLGGESKLTVKAGVTQMDQSETGKKPTYEGSIGVSFPGAVKKKPISLIISGGYGQNADEDGWIGVASLEAPVIKGFTLKAEGFMGENSKQWVTLAGPEAKSNGGWGMVSFGPYSGTMINLGYGMESYSDAGAGAIERNSAGFANVQWSVTKHIILAVEGSRWESKYKDGTVCSDDGTSCTTTKDLAPDNIRGNTAFIYKF